MIGKADAKLPEQGFLFGGGLGDTAETDFAAIGSGENDVGALEGGKQSESFHRRY